MRRTRLFPALALVAVLTACGEGAGDPLGPSSGPRMNGGLVVGGNRTGSDSTDVQRDGADAEAAAAPASGEKDNGGLVVGGN